MPKQKNRNLPKIPPNPLRPNDPPGATAFMKLDGGTQPVWYVPLVEYDKLLARLAGVEDQLESSMTMDFHGRDL